MSVDIADVELPADAAAELTDGELALVTWLRLVALRHRAAATQRQDGSSKRHYSYHEVLLTHGRLFTPAPLPADLTESVPGQCWQNAHEHADARPGELVFVEGYATSERIGHMAIEHAWCARVPGGVGALDITWSPIGGAYLGVPFAHQFRWGNQHREHPQILTCGHQFGRHLLRWGLPPDAVVPGVGRPLPEAARLPQL